MLVFHSGEVVESHAPGTGVLIVGEAPASRDQRVALRVTWCRKRLVKDHGYEGWPDEYWDCANVFDLPQDRSPNGRGFLFHPEETDVDRFVKTVSSYGRVVLLGRSWSSFVYSFRARGIPATCLSAGWGEVASTSTTAFLRWPHPSGLCRLWNDYVKCSFLYSVYRAFVGIAPSGDVQRLVLP